MAVCLKVFFCFWFLCQHIDLVTMADVWKNSLFLVPLTIRRNGTMADVRKTQCHFFWFLCQHINLVTMADVGKTRCHLFCFLFQHIENSLFLVPLTLPSSSDKTLIWLPCQMSWQTLVTFRVFWQDKEQFTMTDVWKDYFFWFWILLTMIAVCKHTFFIFYILWQHFIICYYGNWQHFIFLLVYLHAQISSHFHKLSWDVQVSLHFRKLSWDIFHNFYSEVKNPAFHTIIFTSCRTCLRWLLFFVIWLM